MAFFSATAIFFDVDAGGFYSVAGAYSREELRTLIKRHAQRAKALGAVIEVGRAAP
jgi:hypothetical protein